MNAGEMDERVRFERPTFTDDGFGAVKATGWTPIAEVWASVVAVSDTEKWRASQLGATISHRITVRWSPILEGLKPSDRVIWRGKTLSIGAAKPLKRRHMIEVSATEPV